MDLVIKLAIGIIILIVIGGLYLLIGLAMVIVLMAKYIIDHRKAKLQKRQNQIKESLSESKTATEIKVTETSKTLEIPITENSNLQNGKPTLADLLRDAPLRDYSSRKHVQVNVTTTSGTQNHHIESTQNGYVQKDELDIFKDTIYHIKLLGHEDPRFQDVTTKAFELISKYGDSASFFEEILCYIENSYDFASEVIQFIILQKDAGVSDALLVMKLRKTYITQESSVSSQSSIPFKTIVKKDNRPIYIESERLKASRQLKAKSKIAQKHKALHYANVIGRRLADRYVDNGDGSFYKYISKQCKPLTTIGDYTITTESFEPQNNLIAQYKKSKDKTKSRSIAANIITPKYESEDNQIKALLNILDKLTLSKLPRYDVPSYVSHEYIIEREYKKENPFDIYNDLISSEYSSAALKDRRFSILYQLIIFISSCLESGMTEEETIKAVSSLRVVKKTDLDILRKREIRFKGLSKEERASVLDSEICGDLDMSALYIDLILQHKKSHQEVSLSDYLTGVLLKNYKDSSTAWRLFKYLHLKLQNRTNRYIVNHMEAIHENTFSSISSYGVKESSEEYYSLEDSFIKLKDEYTRRVGVTHYNFERDKVRTDMLNITTIRRYLPKRFDKNDRLCSLVLMSPREADLFKGYDKMVVSNKTYVMIPITALTTNDLYNLLLTVQKQQRKK